MIGSLQILLFFNHLGIFLNDLTLLNTSNHAVNVLQSVYTLTCVLCFRDIERYTDWDTDRDMDTDRGKDRDTDQGKYRDTDRDTDRDMDRTTDSDRDMSTIENVHMQEPVHSVFIKHAPNHDILF